MVFGLGTNQGEEVQRAKNKVSQCQRALRDAQSALDGTHRSENLKATRARDDCQRALRSAEAELRSAEAAARR